MEHISKLERKILEWAASLPHLPEVARTWLGTNVWWIVLVAVVLSAIAVLVDLNNIFTTLTIMGSVAMNYFASSTVNSWVITTAIIGLLFTAAKAVFLAVAVKPLQDKQKKGWVLLFAAWLVSVVEVVVMSVLSLGVFSFIMGIGSGAIAIAVTGYFLFEIHGKFAHVQKSTGVKADKKA